MIVICIREAGDLIGRQPVNWVCPRLGIKGVRCSHSGVGGWREEGGKGVLWHPDSTHDGSQASESMMEVNTTLIVPSVLFYMCIYCTHTYTGTTIYTYAEMREYK